MSKLSRQLEALLLVAAKPVSLKELSSALSVKSKEVEEALEDLAKEYEDSERGFRLLKAGNNYQLVSAAEESDLVQKFLKIESSGELSQPSLEALSIIAYRGPVSKLDLDRIRGVNCSLILRNLLVRGLIEENFDKKKEESYYQVSAEFLRFLGLDRVEKLPDYERLHTPEELEEILKEEVNA